MQANGHILKTRNFDNKLICYLPFIDEELYSKTDNWNRWDSFSLGALYF